MIYRFFADRYRWGPERVSRMTPIQMDMYLTADADGMIDPNSIGHTVGNGGSPSINSSGNLTFGSLEEARKWQRKHQQV